VRTRTFLLAGLVAALLLAGVVSYYASSHPDGLEYVAEKTGFLDAAKDDAAANGPLAADYQVRGVDNGRLAGGLAGMFGVLITLVVAGGVGYAIRRRSSDPELQHTSNES
jgi:cobalt/nickel transport protein